MVNVLSALGRLLAAAPTLLPEGSALRRQAFGRPRFWSKYLHEIYDGVMREPVPQHLSDMVRRERTRKV